MAGSSIILQYLILHVALCFSLCRRGRQIEGSQPIGRKIAEVNKATLLPCQQSNPRKSRPTSHYCGSLLIIISVAEFEHSSLSINRHLLSAIPFASCAVRLILRSNLRHQEDDGRDIFPRLLIQTEESEPLQTRRGLPGGPRPYVHDIDGASYL